MWWLYEQLTYIRLKIRDWWFWGSLGAYGKAANRVDKERSEKNDGTKACENGLRRMRQLVKRQIK